MYSAEHIQNVPDSPANSPDACGRKAYPERKSCGLKSIWIRVDGALKRTLSTYPLLPQNIVERCENGALNSCQGSLWERG